MLFPCDLKTRRSVPHVSLRLPGRHLLRRRCLEAARKEEIVAFKSGKWCFPGTPKPSVVRHMFPSGFPEGICRGTDVLEAERKEEVVAFKSGKWCFPGTPKPSVVRHMFRSGFPEGICRGTDVLKAARKEEIVAWKTVKSGKCCFPATSKAPVV